MNSNNKSLSAKTTTNADEFEPVFLGEISALPEKFSIFPYECISLVWLNDTPTNQIRGNHSKVKRKSNRKERYT